MPCCPEKDPNDKGKVNIPTDPSAAPAKQNVPESKENSDTTKPLTPPAAKKIVGEEKPASLTAKAAAIAGSIKGLIGSLTTKAASDLPVMPPNTQKNDGGEKHTGDTCEKHKNKPGIPDPNAKAAEIASAAAGAAVPKDTTEQKAPAVKDDNKGPIPESKDNANSKAAAINLDEFDAAYHFKLASLLLETEEGRQYAQNLIEKAHGAEAAADLIKAATFMEEKAQALAQAQLEGTEAADDFWKNASTEEKAKMFELMSIHEGVMAGLATDEEKRAYAEGAQDAAGMADAGMMGPEVPPEAGAQAEQISDEDIIAVLDQMVQSGELTPELAAQVLQALQGGEAGGAPAEGGGIPPEAGGLPPDAGAGAGGPPPGAEAGGLPPELMAAAGGAGGPPPDAGGPPPEEEKGAKAIIKRANALAEKLLKAA